MLMLLSPAKSLDFETPPTLADHTVPQFVSESSALIDLLKPLSPAQVADLMSLSDPLAQLNAARFGAWRPRFTARNSKQAVLAFNGDVYEGLNASSLSTEQLHWAQDHLLILSGLYGLLRPLDWMQPYRLEMGTRLANPRGKDLYDWWGDQLVEHLHKRLRKQGSDLLLNLASQEYFKAVKRKSLRARVVECVFEDAQGPGADYKVISFFAKRARGLMARHVIESQIERADQLTGFAAEGYAFAPEASAPERLVFRRRMVA